MTLHLRDNKDSNLDVAWSSVKSLNVVLSPLSMDLPRARNDGCSGLQNQKYFQHKKKAEKYLELGDCLD